MNNNEIVQLKSYDDKTGQEIGNVLPITNSEAVKMEDNKTLTETLTEINEKIKQTNVSLDKNKNELTDKINEVATIGTTTEVLENTTQTYIQEKIKDGTIANMKIDVNSITKERYQNSSIDNNKILGSSAIDLLDMGNLTSGRWFVFDGALTNDNKEEHLRLKNPINIPTGILSIPKPNMYGLNYYSYFIVTDNTGKITYKMTSDTLDNYTKEDATLKIIYLDCDKILKDFPTSEKVYITFYRCGFGTYTDDLYYSLPFILNYSDKTKDINRKSKINWLGVDDDNVKLNSVDIEKIKGIKNLLTSDNVEINKSWFVYNGILMKGDNNSCISNKEPIDVRGYKYLFMQKRNTYSLETTAFITLLDFRKNKILNVNNNSISTFSFITDMGTYYRIDNEALYKKYGVCYVNITYSKVIKGYYYNTLGIETDGLYLYGGDEFPPYELELGQKYIPNILKKNLFEGKIVCGFGDSVTQQNVWLEILARKTGIKKIYNVGIGGSGYCTTKTTWLKKSSIGTEHLEFSYDQPTDLENYIECTNQFSDEQRILTIPLDSEIIILMGGINDHAKGNAGNRNVFTNCYTTLKKIRERCPKATIIVMSQTFHNAMGSEGDIDNIAYEIDNQMKETAEYFSCQYIDLLRTSGINIYNYQENCFDGTHLNYRGGLKVVNTILKNI